MSSHFEYKGYLGSAEVDADNGLLYGRLLFIRDAIGYSAPTVHELKRAFEEAVDDYLAVCAEEGDEPDTPCKGSFNVRVGPERHRVAALRARQMGVGLNEYVCAALDEAAKDSPQRTVVHRHEFVLTTRAEPTKRVATSAQPSTWELLGGIAKQH